MRAGVVVRQEIRVGALVWQEIRVGVRGIFFQCADFRLIAVKNRISFWLPVVMTLQMDKNVKQIFPLDKTKK